MSFSFVSSGFADSLKLVTFAVLVFQVICCSVRST